MLDMNEDVRIVSQRLPHFFDKHLQESRRFPRSLLIGASDDDARRQLMQTIRASIRCMIALAALTLWVSFAADIDGKWTGEVQGRNGPQTQTLMLKSSGNTLTGTVQGARGGPVEITNGTIDGDNVSFTVVREFGENKITPGVQGQNGGRRTEAHRVRRARRTSRGDLQKGIAHNPTARLSAAPCSLL